MNRAAFLDRDGVINKSIIIDGVPTPPKNLSQVKILRGVIEAIKILKLEDITPIVITNQPDVARGLTSHLEVNQINSYIGEILGIENFYTCFHDDSARCFCRKPNPGLLSMAAQDLNIDINDSFLVGDRWKDIVAGQSFGVRCYFVDYCYNEKVPSGRFTKVSSLLEAVQIEIGGNLET